MRDGTQGLAPGSKQNNMAAVIEINVSPQIDNLTKSMNFHEEERLDVWKKNPFLHRENIFDVNKHCGAGENKWFENANVHPRCTSGNLIIFFRCDSC